MKVQTEIGPGKLIHSELLLRQAGWRYYNFKGYATVTGPDGGDCTLWTAWMLRTKHGRLIAPFTVFRTREDARRKQRYRRLCGEHDPGVVTREWRYGRSDEHLNQSHES